jgi:putative effector of murein hydrolase
LIILFLSSFLISFSLIAVFIISCSIPWPNYFSRYHIIS